MWWGVLEKGQCLDGDIQYYGDYNITSYSDTDIEEQEYRYVYNYEYEDGKDDDDEFFKQYEVPVYAVPFIFGTTCNVILLIINTCNKNMSLNLAISDIIYLCFIS